MLHVLVRTVYTGLHGQRPGPNPSTHSMHISSETSGQFDYRLLENDRIEGEELRVGPDPSRLRTACLMIYAGLLLTLAAMLSSVQAAAAQPPEPSVMQNPAGAGGSIAREGLENFQADSTICRLPGGGVRRLPLFDQRCRLMAPAGMPYQRRLAPAATIETVPQVAGLQIELRYLVVVIAVLLSLLLVSRWRIADLRRRDTEMNEIIEKRTRTLREMNARLDELSRTDELTGIANHRRLRFYLAEQWRACAGAGLPLTLVIMDVDHFKQFNDSMGHQAGDRFLRAMAQSLSRLVKAEGGLLARYGGEEFLAVLPRRTLAEGSDFAETLRGAVISLEFSQAGAEPGFVTASFGVASLVPGPDASPEDLIRMADHAMYEAKRGGRNRVCTASGRSASAASGTFRQ